MEIRLEGAPNFRDVGGYPAAKGFAVRRGLVFRSGHFANLTDADLESFAELGIRTVVDFRPSYEQAMSGVNRLPADINYVEVPIGDPAMAPEVKRALHEGDFTALPDLRDANRTLIREFSSQLGEALRLIAEPRNLPLAFHCIGGKDRTGMAAALLLTILGVPWSEVKVDYMKTNGRFSRAGDDVDTFIDKLAAERDWGEMTQESRNALRRFFVLEEEYIEAAWEEIEQVAGTFCSYVHRYLGASDEMIQTMRANLLERV